MKKIFSIVGMSVSVATIILGIFVATGVFGSARYYGGDSPYSSGYASFGADYYTYSVNNTAETTSAVNAVSSNLREISSLLTSSLGLFIVCFGLLAFCGFAILYSNYRTSCKGMEFATETDEEIICEDVQEQLPEVKYEE